VLSGSIIDYLKRSRGLKTAFAFLTYQDAKTTALAIIHSLTFQLTETDEGLMAIVCEAFDDDDQRSNLAAAGNLLSSLITYVGSGCLVIDGIDEVDVAERCRLITELLRLVKACKEMRIVLSGRSEADLARLLDDATASIQIHNHNEGSIRGYVHERTQLILDTRKVLPQAQNETKRLLAPLAERAKGMFLYARLVMDMVETMNDLSEIQDELAVLPENLDDIYHRIIVRIGEQKDKRSAEQAQRLLGWISCTPTPLTIQEAQQALAIKPEKRDQIYNRFGELNVVEMLGPIVESIDDYIRFVHFTAKEYISSPHLKTKLIGIKYATLDLAVQCISYLCQHHHDLDLANEQRLDNVITGQYVFHAFSTRLWFDLVCQYLRLMKREVPSATFVDSLKMLLDCRTIRNLRSTYGGSEYDGDDDSEDNSEDDSEDYNESDSVFHDIFAILKTEHPQHHRLLCKVSRFRNSSFLFTGNLNQGTMKFYNLWIPRH
jgi:hypothetical protein